MNENKIVVIDRTESFLESFCSDLATFSFLGFSIWLSQGSTWWTWFTGVMFLIFAFGKLSVQANTKTKYFKTKEELIEWANSLDWKK